MRGGRDLSRSLPVAEAPSGPRSDWRTLGRLLPYLWQYKWRVAAALLFVIGAKVANVSVPLLLKELIDRMTLKPGDPAALLVVPVGLLLAYGALRLMTSAFTELANWCSPRPRRAPAGRSRCRPSSTCTA